MILIRCHSRLIKAAVRQRYKGSPLRYIRYTIRTMAVRTIKVLCLLLCVRYGTTAPPQTTTPKTPTEEEEIKDLKQTIESLGRQLMLQQFFVEEKTRSDGDSGIKTIRLYHEGSRPYISESFTAHKPAELFEYPYSRNFFSVGPLNAVINGVDFKAPRIFYGLKRPSTRNKNFNELEDIPFPHTPPRVKNKRTVMEQIEEMKQYFKAFKEQDPTIRPDYEKYFKPVMCYLEGGWMADTDSQNDASHLQKAKMWFNILARARYYLNSGMWGHLTDFHPIKIMEMRNSTPVYVRWDYRVACHPIKYNLKRSDMILVDDLSTRMQKFKTFDNYVMSPAARFRISGVSGKHYNSTTGVGHEDDRTYQMEILDHIMQEIPGKDNYRGYMSDESFGMYHDNMAFNNRTRLNTAYYHRMYKVEEKDAMGISVVRRGYNDVNMWTAQTTNPKVARMKVNVCQHRVCNETSTRYTYAIPLEIVWMSPLLTWNPFNLKYIPGDPHKSPANAVDANHRNGRYDLNKAFNGTNDRHYLMTPHEFYYKGVVGNNTQHGHGVLDKDGVIRSVQPSGVRMFYDIRDIGKLRMIYPIFPIHDEGHTIWKELDALKEMSQNIEDFAKYFETNPSQFISKLPPDVPKDEHYLLSTTHMDPPGVHNHEVYITPEGMTALSKNQVVTAYTSLNIGHQHQIDIKKDSHGRFVIASCDGRAKCWDGHTNALYHQTS